MVIKRPTVIHKIVPSVLKFGAFPSSLSTHMESYKRIIDTWLHTQACVQAHAGVHILFLAHR